LKLALNNLLRVKPKEKIEDGILLITEILISDHPTMAEYLLKNLSFQLLYFIK